MAVDLEERVVLSHGYRTDAPYAALVLNVTNRCNLSCAHCFVFRDDNPNEPVGPRSEIPDDELLEIVAAVRDRHSIPAVLWMGGEPLLRRSVLEQGVRLFRHNTVVTNGTLPLVDLGPEVLYVVSLDGPPDVNDAVRGRGSYASVMRNLERLPATFDSPVQVQCTVTRANEDRLEELVELLTGTRVGWITFSFYVPPAHDTSGLGWDSPQERMGAVAEVRRLKAARPGFVRNRARALDMMEPDLARAVVADCPAKRSILPLYLDGPRFVTPFCCYGNDVDCALCGAWVVFELAGARPRPAAAKP